jgi:predicted transcriptional regulator
MKRFFDYKTKEKGLSKVLGPLENDVMNIIWGQENEVTVREVFDLLVLQKEMAYTTVMTIMVRLAEKNILEKRKEGKTMYFKPKVSKEAFTGEVVGSVVDSLLEDFAEVAMARFVSSVKKGDKETILKLEALLKEQKEG